MIAEQDFSFVFAYQTYKQWWLKLFVAWHASPIKSMRLWGMSSAKCHVCWRAYTLSAVAPIGTSVPTVKQMASLVQRRSVNSCKTNKNRATRKTVVVWLLHAYTHNRTHTQKCKSAKLRQSSSWSQRSCRWITRYKGREVGLSFILTGSLHVHVQWRKVQLNSS